MRVCERSSGNTFWWRMRAPFNWTVTLFPWKFFFLFGSYVLFCYCPLASVEVDAKCFLLDHSIDVSIWVVWDSISWHKAFRLMRMLLFVCQDSSDLTHATISTVSCFFLTFYLFQTVSKITGRSDIGHTYFPLYNSSVQKIPMPKNICFQKF